MRILIVEDDARKVRALRDVAVRVVSAIIIDERKSYQSGLKKIVDEPPDLVLLDMSMPTYDISPTERGGRTRAYGGRDILMEIVRRGISTRVIVITQFETFGEGDEKKTLNELRDELERSFAGVYLGSVYYNAAQSDWQNQLAALICSIDQDKT